ncbi:putative pectate lyase [Helianthus debilis subsp. tardiflorus]
MEYHYLVLIFTLTFALMVQSNSAWLGKTEKIIADTEDYLDKNANAAAAAMEAYNPELLASLTDTDSTRRDLHECHARNPIDKCWRGKADWAENRQALAQCVTGFAKGTTGGAAGEIYTVTCCSDEDATNPRPGTLRYGVTQEKPLWIIFERDMVITLKHTLVVSSDKTIDGRGAKVEIAHGGGITIHGVNNVIVHGINIHDVREMPGFGSRCGCDGDAITVKSSSKIWIDHCSLSKGVDGLIDVTVGSTAVTISNCKFTNHDKAILLGADDKHTEDKAMHVTVAYNKFEGITQRMPRCRFGFFQVVNNDHCGWGIYAIGGSSNPTILSQGNRFCAPNEAHLKKVTMRTNANEEEWKNWNWRSSDKDVFENGAVFVPSGVDPQLTPEQQEHMIEAEPGCHVPKLTCCAGVLSCVPGQPC